MFAAANPNASMHLSRREHARANDNKHHAARREHYVLLRYQDISPPAIVERQNILGNESLRRTGTDRASLYEFDVNRPGRGIPNPNKANKPTTYCVHGRSSVGLCPGYLCRSTLRPWR